MKDLEIRGAGDLLGGEQSGFINEIGFETYQKILEEAIDELKENEFKTLFEDQDKSLEKNYVKEVQIDTDFEILFPDDYINIVNERLVLYNELSAIKDEEGLIQFQKIWRIALVKFLRRRGAFEYTSTQMACFQNGIGETHH